jgi:hypothetical protein
MENPRNDMTTNEPAALGEFTKYDVPFPFFRVEKSNGFDTGWRIGVRDRGTPDASADGMGALIISTLAIVHPGGKYGRRVFYTQSWRDPDGRAFGSPVLRCDSVTSVERGVRGFKGDYVLNEPPAPPPLLPVSPRGVLRLVGGALP